MSKQTHATLCGSDL